MTKRKRISLWIAGVIGSLLLLLVIAMISLPGLVGQQQIKGKIQSTLSRQLGGEVEFDTILTSFFPPKGEILGVRLELPDISGSAGSVNAGFQILPLFRGKLKLDEIVIKDPNFTIPLPELAEEDEKPNEATKEWTPERIGKRISDLLARIEAGMPGVSIKVQDGVVSLTRKGEPLYRIQDLDAEIGLPSEKLQIDLTAASNVWETMTFKGKIDADGSNAGGEFDVRGLRPELLSRYFAPGALKEFESARIALKLGFESESFDEIRGNLQGSAVYEKIPDPVEVTEVKFAYSGESLVLDGFKIKAGKSHLGASSALLGLDGKENLKIESAEGNLDLGQMLPWAAPLLWKIEGFKDLAADYKDLKGMFSFSALDLQGPLMEPEKWRFEGKGKAENLVLESDELPGPLNLERGEFVGTGERISVKLQKLALLGSSLSLSGFVENPLAETAGIDVSIGGDIGSKTIRWITGKFDPPVHIADLQGRVKITDLNVKGPISKPKELFFEGSGSVEKGFIKTDLLPDAVAVEKGAFVIGPKVVSLEGVQVGFLNSSMTVSGSIREYMKGLSSLDLKLNGSVSEKAAAFLKEKGLIPSWINTDAPVSVSGGNFVRGPESQTVFAADLQPETGPRIGLRLENGPEKLTIQELTVNDSKSKATLSISLADKVVDIDFEGQLAGETVHKLIEGREDLSGWIRGDFNLHVPTQAPAGSRIQGAVQAGGVTYGKGLNARVQVREVSIRGEGDRIRIDSADLLWRETDIEVNGNVGFSPKGIVLDLLASTEGFDWEKINRIVEEESKEESSKGEEQPEKAQETEPEGAFGGLKLEGKVAVKADYFKYGDLTWRPFQVTLNLENKRLWLQLTQGNLCGIRTEATARITPDPMRIDAEAEAKDKPLGPALNCFLESKLMTGDFDLAGDITTRGGAENFLDNLQGQFRFTAEDGRIVRYGLLAKILAVVNITEILKGQAPDFAGEGFGYKSAKASGVIENGILRLTETYIDGKSINLAFAGNLDIAQEQIDLTVLVTPLKTVDSIIERIPIIGHIAGKNFMAIPVRVRGDLSDPTVTPMSASAVGKGLLGVLERTLKLPVRIVQPFFPDQEKKKG